MDENQAVDMCTGFLRKKQGKNVQAPFFWERNKVKNVQPKSIDLVKSYCNIKNKDILK